MSSEKNKFGEVEFSCDRCGEVVGSDEKEFKTAWLAVQEKGWKYRGDGKHVCPSCAEEIRMPR